MLIMGEMLPWIKYCHMVGWLKRVVEPPARLLKLTVPLCLYMAVCAGLRAKGSLYALASVVQVSLVGRQRLVLDLSCRKKDDGRYYVVTDRWQRFSDLALSEETLARLAASCDEFLVHGVDVEGMQLGIDDELVELLGKWAPIPVTYAGGARTLVSLAWVLGGWGGFK